MREENRRNDTVERFEKREYEYRGGYCSEREIGRSDRGRGASKRVSSGSS